jgi:hypothetical protein
LRADLGFVRSVILIAEGAPLQPKRFDLLAGSKCFQPLFVAEEFFNLPFLFLEYPRFGRLFRMPGRDSDETEYKQQNASRYPMADTDLGSWNVE